MHFFFASRETHKDQCCVCIVLILLVKRLNNENSKPPTYIFYGFCKHQVICDNFSKFWEMPSIPLTTPHHIIIEFFVQVIKKWNGLNYHCVYLVWTEFQLVSWQTKIAIYIYCISMADNLVHTVHWTNICW